LRCRARRLLRREWESQQKKRLQELVELESDQVTGRDEARQMKRLELVLDLDNTLIHSVGLTPDSNDSGWFEINNNIFVYKRPHLEFFL